MISIDHSHWDEIAGPPKAGNTLVSVTERLQERVSELPLFRLDYHLKLAQKHRQLALEIQQKYTNIVLLGTGGSSLGAQVLYRFKQPSKVKLQFHFLDNIDPISFGYLWSQLDLSKTLFLIISKSGSTPETIAQALEVITHLQKNLIKHSIQDHLLFMSEPNPSPLRNLATQFHCKCLDLPADIGGRFSIFSTTGLFPAMLMNVDTQGLLRGAQHTLNELKECSANAYFIEGAGLIQQLTQSRSRNQVVFMPYVDQLEPLGRWWRQLWAESTGKNGKGATPIPAMGTVDQHSQLQLYLEGPDNKLFTLLLHPLTVNESKVSENLAKSIGAEYLANHSMGDLLQAEQLATLRVLKEAGRPTRIIKVSELNEATLGALMMTMILETLAMAEILDVNAFDQPAVEAGKQYAKTYLTNQ